MPFHDHLASESVNPHFCADEMGEEKRVRGGARSEDDGCGGEGEGDGDGEGDGEGGGEGVSSG